MGEGGNDGQAIVKSPTTYENLIGIVKEALKPGSEIYDEGYFDALARNLYENMLYNNSAYNHSLSIKRTKLPYNWRMIPCLPISYFKREVVTSFKWTDEPQAIFKSSGTGGSRSEHYLHDLDLYEASIAGAFLQLILQENRWMPGYKFVAVTPPLQDSSLYHMLNYLADQLGREGGMFVDPTDRDQVDRFFKEVESVKGDTPFLLFGTSLAFFDLSVPKGKDLTLHPLSKVITTGGWKGRDIDISQRDLEVGLQHAFNLEPHNIRREYSMSELSSQLYAVAADQPEYFSMPWMKYRVVDPISNADVEVGAIQFYDLANAYSCPFIMTEDLGMIGPNGGLVLLGRMTDSEMKGCSLTYEEYRRSRSN